MEERKSGRGGIVKAAGLGSLVEVLGQISQLHWVEVLSVRAACEEIRYAGAWVPSLTVDVHTGDHTTAFLLSVRWGLDEEVEEVRGLPGGRRMVWRTWSDWVRELTSPDRRVWLRVSGVEPFDPDADPLGFNPPADQVVV